jgi:hemoglobin
MMTRFALWIGTLLTLFGAVNARADTATFAAFGGKPGLEKIMDDMMDHLTEDPRTADFFAPPVDLKHVKKMLVIQCCELLGGGCVYEGLDMQSAHEGMGVKRENFNALIEALQDAMDENNVPFRAQNKLLSKLAPMHRDIVEKPLDGEPASVEELPSNEL